VFGFRVFIRPAPAAPEAGRVDVGAVADDLAALLDANDLVAAGGRARGDAAGGTREYVVTRDGSQATDADRTLVREWAARWRTRAAIEIGDLIDLQEFGA